MALLASLVLTSCATGGGTRLPELSSEERAHLTAQEIEWLQGQTPADFAELMAHLENAPPSERKDAAIEKALGSWPDEARLVPDLWLARLMRGERIERIHHARAMSLAWVDLSVPFLRQLFATPAFTEALDYVTVLGLQGALLFDDASIPALVQSKHLRGVERLDLSFNAIDRQGVQALAESKNLESLTHLTLILSELDDDDVAVLVGSKNLPNLTYLNLVGNQLGDDGLRALARAGTRQNFTSLHVFGFDINPDVMREFFNAPELQGLERLFLAMNLGDEGARLLANSTVTDTLTYLHIGGDELGMEGANALANASGLQGLAYLGVVSSELGPKEVDVLVGSPNFVGLHELNLSRNELGADGARAIVRSRLAESLRVLSLEDVSLGDAGVQVLARSKRLDKLESLQLADNAIGPEGAQALASAGRLRDLKKLDLSDNPLGVAGAKALARMKYGGSLREVDLSNCGIGDEGLAALASSDFLRGVHTLRLAANKIGAAGIRALATSKHVGELRTLRLRTNALGDVGVDALTESPKLRSLRRLDLGANGVTASGAAALGSWTQLRFLRDLDLSDNRIGSRGARALAGSKWLVGVTRLDLSENPIGDSGAIAFSSSKFARNLVELELDQEYFARTPDGLTIQEPGARALSESVHLLPTVTYDWKRWVVNNLDPPVCTRETKADIADGHKDREKAVSQLVGKSLKASARKWRNDQVVALSEELQYSYKLAKIDRELRRRNVSMPTTGQQVLALDWLDYFEQEDLCIRIARGGRGEIPVFDIPSATAERAAVLERIRKVVREDDGVIATRHPSRALIGVTDVFVPPIFIVFTGDDIKRVESVVSMVPEVNINARMQKLTLERISAKKRIVEVDGEPKTYELPVFELTLPDGTSLKYPMEAKKEPFIREDELPGF